MGKEQGPAISEPPGPALGGGADEGRSRGLPGARQGGLGAVGALEGGAGVAGDEGVEPRGEGARGAEGPVEVGRGLVGEAAECPRGQGAHGPAARQAEAQGGAGAELLGGLDEGQGGRERPGRGPGAGVEEGAPDSGSGAAGEPASIGLGEGQEALGAEGTAAGQGRPGRGAPGLEQRPDGVTRLAQEARAAGEGGGVVLVDGVKTLREAVERGLQEARQAEGLGGDGIARVEAEPPLGSASAGTQGAETGGGLSPQGRGHPRRVGLEDGGLATAGDGEAAEREKPPHRQVFRRVPSGRTSSTQGLAAGQSRVDSQVAVQKPSVSVVG